MFIELSDASDGTWPPRVQMHIGHLLQRCAVVVLHIVQQARGFRRKCHNLYVMLWGRLLGYADEALLYKAPRPLQAR